jgi:fumarate hydratase class II
VIQVGAQVTGNCQAIVIGGQWGQLDLNVMLPMMARNMLESIDLLANVSRLFVDKSLAGAVANVERAEGYVERSIAMATALNPHIGYEAAAAIAKQSYATGRTVRQIAYEETGLSRKQVDEILHPHQQTVAGTGAGQAAGG